MPREVNSPATSATDMRLYLRDEELDRGAGLLLLGERALSAAAESSRKHAGLSQSEMLVLVTISQFPGQDVSQLRDRLAMTVPTCARLLGELDRRGLIERQRDGEDRRRRALILSPDGETCLAPVFSSIRAVLRVAYKSAGPEAVAGVRALLEALAR